MKKFISFPKISDFKNAVRDLSHSARYMGEDENGQVIYNHDPLPTITFTGTVKLNGTNSGVCYNNESGFWVQSRNRIITPQKDNAGFAFFAETNKEAFIEIIKQVAVDNDLSLDEYTITVYGEYAGIGIQKNVAIIELEKTFYLFGVNISKPQDPEFNAYWVDSTKYVNEDHKIYNVDKFKTYEMEIDLNNPKIAVNDMIELVNDVETECPISKARGVSGIGEGIVWRTEYKGSTIRFKTKGAKHSVTKVKKLVQVDSEKLRSVADFVAYSVTQNRVDQGIQLICGDDQPTRTKTGPFLKWLVNDIIDEEIATLADNKLEPKDVTSALSSTARNMFFKACDEWQNNQYENVH